MKVLPIAEIVEFLTPIAEEVGVEIIDAAWNVREGALTLYIDAAGGVDLTLCEKFHRAVDGPLDELDPTFGAPYTLNCSSAGLDRPFKTQRDFERHYGERVELHLYAPIGGKKLHDGELVSYNGAEIVLKVGDEEKTFPAEKVSKACLYIEV